MRLSSELNTVEALLTDTLISGRLLFWPFSQNSVFLNSHTNSVFFIPVSGQLLQLRTPFSRPKGVRLRERPLYIILLYSRNRQFLFHFLV